MSDKRSQDDSASSPLGDSHGDSLGDSQAPGPLRRWLRRRQRVQAEDEQRISESAADADVRETEAFARLDSDSGSGSGSGPTDASGEASGLRDLRTNASPAEEVDDGLEEKSEGGGGDGAERAEGAEGKPEEKILTDADMPPIESLDEHSDYSGFLSPGVSEELRRRALRKLFFSAAFNIRDGLDDYDDDFTSFEALGDMVTADMKHQQEVEAEKAQAAQAEAEAKADAEAEDIESTRTAEPAPESTPEEDRGDDDMTQDRLAARDDRQTPFKDESAATPDATTPAADRPLFTESTDPKNATTRQTPPDANHRPSTPSDPRADRDSPSPPHPPQSTRAK